MKHPFFKSISLLLAALLLLSGCAVDLGDLAAALPTDAPAPPPLVVVTETPESPSEPPAQVLPPETPYPDPTPSPFGLDEDGEYTNEMDVAAYLNAYGHLPSNFITKKEAQALGWPGGDLWKYAPGKSIGGDYFGNYEGLLPKGRYHECDVNYAGGSRGAERIIYGEDGSIWYTADHYETFTKLY